MVMSGIGDPIYTTSSTLSRVLEHYYPRRAFQPACQPSGPRRLGVPVRTTHARLRNRCGPARAQQTSERPTQLRLAVLSHRLAGAPGPNKTLPNEPSRPPPRANGLLDHRRRRHRNARLALSADRNTNTGLHRVRGRPFVPSRTPPRPRPRTAEHPCRAARTRISQPPRLSRLARQHRGPTDLLDRGGISRLAPHDRTQLHPPAH